MKIRMMRIRETKTRWAREIHFPAAAFTSITWPVDRTWRKACHFAVRAVKFAIYCADCYSATVLYEELSRLSHQDLERCGIARGNLHRDIMDALPK
jgi:hypothetical protein